MRITLFLLFSIQILFSQNNSIITYGEDLIHKNKLDEAILYFNQNLKSVTSDSDKIEMYLCLADIYKLQLNFEEAKSNYSYAYKIIKETNNTQLEFLYHVKLGEFYRKRNLDVEFEEELKKADKLLKTHKIKDKFLTKYYSRKAALFTEFYHNNDSTLFYAQKSLDLSLKVDDKDNVFYSTLEIAGVFERDKNYTKSIEYLEYIIVFACQNNMKQHEADAYISYIMALARDHQLEKALEKAIYAARLSKENNLLYNEIIFNENIQNLYARLGQIDKAYEYLKYRLELTSKYNDLKNEEILFNLEAKYKLNEKEDLITIKNLEIDNKNKALSESAIKFYSILGLFLVAFIVVVLSIFFLNKTKKQNKQLQYLSKQNQFLVSETNHRVNNNLQLVSLLIENNIRKKNNQEDKVELNHLLTKVEAIASLHRHLYKTNNVNTLDLKNYLTEIKNNFSELITEENIQIEMYLDTVDTTSDNALQYGLLLSELFINSMKHAFIEYQTKKIEVSLIKKTEALAFSYKDNGKKNTNTVIKPALVEQLCTQLEVNYKIETDDGFTLIFEKNIPNA